MAAEPTTQTPAPGAAEPSQPSESTPAEPDRGPERDDVPAPTLSLAVDPPAANPAGLPAALRPGELTTLEPEIPAELDAKLNARERRIVWSMVNGSSYEQAHRRHRGGNPRAPIPDHVQAAVDATLRSIAYSAGTSRLWIINQTVALYRRACQAEEVLDRKGRPTGVYRFDGGTAARCLELLGKAEGVFRDRKPGTFAPGDVAALLEAVAARRAAPPGRLVGESPPARIAGPGAGRGGAASTENPE